MTEKTDPGILKGSQNKGDKIFIFLHFFIRFIIYNNKLIKKEILTNEKRNRGKN